MRIKGNGNVGIGTTAPAIGKFVVEGMVGNTVAVFKNSSSTSKGVVIGSIIAPAASVLAAFLGPRVADALDMGDDIIGQCNISLSPKQLVVLAHSNNSVERQVGYKVVSPLLAAFGASYKIYFGIVGV